ncbi:nck-associated protein 1-like isoform X4 [Mytilus californianus]|uniref:nck-associated protein 1-like isoform X4 n=1 Tax=Mytilus californianus TaxID=6549 RepID=UPI0022485FAA|nr:nck-associated protein 1-like isoform X4 [Mytilus californianus]
MSRGMMPSQQKLAEKLTIMNDRGRGMLTRIYNIKKMLGNPENKPSFLSEKSLDAPFKYLSKKFPNIDSKSSTLSPIQNIKADVVKSLSLYYYTFVDIMDFKDHVTDLLTTIDACQVHLDIALNYDLTKQYLDLMVTYVSIMVLVSKVDDRRLVLSLFNVAHEFLHGAGDASFPRLGQMVQDYDHPMKKMSEEFVPHSRVLIPAIMSLHVIYPKRNLTAEMMRSTQMLSLLAEPAKIMNSPITDMVQCEYLSQDVMEKWIIFGLMLCYQYLQEAKAWDLWKQVLQSGYIVQLCRDEVLHIHGFIVSFFETIKGHNMKKKIDDVREFQHSALQTSPGIHKERRKFLRSALRELTQIYADQPGLLGPKALYVWQGLSVARDEIHWLLRHFDNPPSKRHNIKLSQEDFVDRQLPELLFYMEELRGLVKKYNQVLQRYFVQYLSGYDSVLLNQLIQNLAVCPEDESIILSSLYNTVASLTVKQVEENVLFDFRGIRLDWFRLQAYTSVGKAALILKDHIDIAKHMNTICFHTKMVDYLDQMLVETSDLSIYCFYTQIYEHQFKQCMEFPAQHRFSIVFPMICAHFMNATHELCPEERHSIGTTSVQYTHWFLKEMSDEVNQVITAICEEQCMLSDKLLPKHSADTIIQTAQKKRPQDKKKKTVAEPIKPGQESARKNREVFTRMDKLHMALTELCYAINYCNVIQVWEHGFVPREFFLQHLETRFNKALVGMMMYNPDTSEIAKPSELLNSVKSVMNVLQGLENYVNIDIARIFNSVLPQQTQHIDSFTGEKTITANYTNWYLEVLLRRVTVNAGQNPVIFSPNHKAFVSIQTDGNQFFAAEEYADLTELRALAELIGPYGMKYMGERLMNHVASQVDELKKLVVGNKEVLQKLRTNYDKPEVMRDLYRQLTRPKQSANTKNTSSEFHSLVQNVDSVLLRMTIIGVLLSFRQLAQEALIDVLDDRIPFLMASVKDLQHFVPSTKDLKVVNEMSSASGLSCDVDPTLINALRQQKSERRENEYEVACLLMVFVAVAIPKLARQDSSVYKAALEGNVNNCHCLALAVNQLAGALFSIHGPGDVHDRLQEFLALASSSLLRLGQENDKEAVKNRESVYILLDKIVTESPFLTMDLLESCFPYALLRNAYHSVYKASAADV